MQKYFNIILLMLPLLLHAQQKFCAAIELTGERLILGEILQNPANDSVLTVKTLPDKQWRGHLDIYYYPKNKLKIIVRSKIK